MPNCKELPGKPFFAYPKSKLGLSNDTQKGSQSSQNQKWAAAKLKSCLSIQLFCGIMENGNATNVIKTSFKNLLIEIVDKFHMAPLVCESDQKIEAEQKAAKITIEHL
ncbi:hypothetical protein RHGRI_025713 [Rhododendron griersonianum]|uniref:Uncharacterized protein n=1 Tax=Rhododendron griersonianum TaxID=479676 RepID=A0AAV6IQA4_9ERIC|nr:hypothetical protein RHGRI_025713 [Rhododendron griersonianum]